MADIYTPRDIYDAPDKVFYPDAPLTDAEWEAFTTPIEIPNTDWLQAVPSPLPDIDVEAAADQLDLLFQLLMMLI